MVGHSAALQIYSLHGDGGYEDRDQGDAPRDREVISLFYCITSTLLCPALHIDCIDVFYRYNPENIKTLETYVGLQAKEKGGWSDVHGGLSTLSTS
jgi:hypothetical protein